MKVTIGRRKTEKALLHNMRRETITSAARDLFLKKGVKATKIDDIAEYADMTKWSLYRYFRSKDEIAVNVMRQAAKMFQEEIRGVELIDSREGFFRYIHNVCMIIFRYYFDYGDISAFLRFRESTKKEFIELLKEHGIFVIDETMAIRKLVQEGIDKGYFRRVNPEYLTNNLFAAIMGRIMITKSTILEKQPIDIEKAVKNDIYLILLLS